MAHRENNKPHVVFLAVDDFRHDFGRVGSVQPHTPNLDRLRAAGLHFTNAHCQSPVCMPSRASAISGKRPPLDRPWAARVDEMNGPGEPSLPEHFKNHGYHTVSAGKVLHFNDDADAAWTLRHDDTFTGPADGHGYCAGYQLPENQRLAAEKRARPQHPSDPAIAAADLPPLFEAADAPDDDYPDAVVARRGVERIEAMARTGDPTFLALGFYRPHLPWAVPKKYWDLYDPDAIDLAAARDLPENAVGKNDTVDLKHYGDPEVRDTFVNPDRPLASAGPDDFPVLSDDKQRRCIHGYLASVAFLDAQIGRVLDAIEHNGLADDTLVVLWADHGFHLGEHRLWAKCTTFEQATRVPLIVAGPGVEAGRACDGLVELLDVFPTLCDLAGLPTPDHCEGRSLRPLLDDPTRPGKPAAFASLHHFRSVRTPTHRLTRYLDIGEVGEAWMFPSRDKLELFDLVRDPQQTVNIADDPAAASVRAELLDRLDRVFTTAEAAADAAD